MATLVKSIQTVQKHATVSYNASWNVFEPYIKQAERKHLKPAVSRELLSALIAEETPEGLRADVIELLEEASTKLALLAYSKTAIITIGDNGLMISQSQNSKPAEWWQVRDLQRELFKSGTDAIDEALEIMEASETDFQEWVNTQSYTKFKELFTQQTKNFQRWYNINNSRLTFQQLRPHLLKVEDKYFNALLGSETIFQIKNGSTPEENKALEICQSAQVMLCLAEVAEEGLFLIDRSGLFIVSDEVQGESKQGLTQKERDNFSLKKQQDGNEYLRKLVNYLKDNPEVFVQYALKEETEKINPVYNTKSTVSF